MALKGKNKKKSSFRKKILVTQKSTPFNYIEAYKALRTNLKFIAATEKANSFVVTSALAMEGKSNVAINLAITLAEEGKQVALVDCDFRKPTIHQYLKKLGTQMSGYGITDVIKGDCNLGKAVYHVVDWNVDVLPVGTVPPNPSELLSTEQMGVVMDALKKVYDYVIVDAPPVSVVTDAAIIGGLVDGAILVVRSDFAPVETIELAQKKLQDVNVRIFGVVLSRFDSKTTGSKSGYSYSNDYYYNDDGN